MVMFGPGVTAILIGGVLYGLYLIHNGFEHRDLRLLVRNTPTSTVNSVALGPVEVRGTAAAADGDTVTAPVSGDDCVLVAYEVERWSDAEGSWQSIATGIASPWFLLRDETGTVPINPTGATVKVGEENTHSRVIKNGQEPPEVEAFLDRRPDVSVPLATTSRVYSRFAGGMRTVERKRRYTERVIRPDEDVYLFGMARSPHIEARGPPGDTDLFIGCDADREMPFLIATESEATRLKRRKWTLAWRIPVGAFLSGSCAALLLFGAGIL